MIKNIKIIGLILASMVIGCQGAGAIADYGVKHNLECDKMYRLSKAGRVMLNQQPGLTSAIMAKYKRDQNDVLKAYGCSQRL